MKKNFILFVCAVSPLLAAKPAERAVITAELNASNLPVHKAAPVDVVVPAQAVKHADDIAISLNELKNGFERWGVNSVWDQVRGKNTNEFGSRNISTIYGLFSGAKRPLTAVVDGKYVSSNPDIDGKAADGAHIQQIKDALASSEDGQIVVSGKRLSANPVDKDGGMIEVSFQCVAWDNRAFGIKDHQFFVFVETQA